MSQLNILATFLKNPKQIITLGYQSMMRKNNELSYEKEIQRKYNKTQLPSIDLLDLVPDLHETINKYSFLSYTSLISDILLLKSLAKRFKECSYLEIGALRGESLSSVAEVAKDVTSITLSNEEMRQFNVHEDLVRSHGIYLKDTKNLTTYYHNSLTFDFSTLGKKFDMIFVDGDHSYNGVVTDTRNVFKLLKDENSVIVWHDYGNHIEDVRHEVLAAILDGVPQEFHKNLYHVSNTMCAVFIRGDFKTFMAQEASYPNKVFKVEVTATKL